MFDNHRSLKRKQLRLHSSTHCSHQNLSVALVLRVLKTCKTWKAATIWHDVVSLGDGGFLPRLTERRDQTTAKTRFQNSADQGRRSSRFGSTHEHLPWLLCKERLRYMDNATCATKNILPSFFQSLLFNYSVLRTEHLAFVLDTHAVCRVTNARGHTCFRENSPSKLIFMSPSLSACLITLMRNFKWVLKTGSFCSSCQMKHYLNIVSSNLQQDR